jgi:hypothetical protein
MSDSDYKNDSQKLVNLYIRVQEASGSNPASLPTITTGVLLGVAFVQILTNCSPVVTFSSYSMSYNICSWNSVVIRVSKEPVVDGISVW